MTVVPDIAVADPRCGVDELALIVVVASHGHAGASVAQLADRLSWGRARLRVSRQILEEHGYISVETRDRGELVFRVRTACGTSGDASTPGCADGLNQTRSLGDAPSGCLNQTRSTEDGLKLSTPGVEPKPDTSSNDAASPQNPQPSTTSRQNPPTPHAVVPPAEDVEDEEAPPGAAAPGDPIVQQALEILADRELDSVFMSGTQVHDRKQLYRHIVARLRRDHAAPLAALARTVDVSSGRELLDARRRARELDSADQLGRRWAHLQTDVDIAGLAANQFRRAADPPGATAACIDAYRAERQAGRAEWRERAHAFGIDLAGRRAFTVDEVEQRAVQRFGFDEDLTQITLAAWRAANERKASA